MPKTERAHSWVRVHIMQTTRGQEPFDKAPNSAEATMGRQDRWPRWWIFLLFPLLHIHHQPLSTLRTAAIEHFTPIGGLTPSEEAVPTDTPTPAQFR